MPAPHLCPVYDVSVDGARLMVELDMMRGHGLKDVLARLRRPPHPEEVAAVGAGMAKGLLASRHVRDALGADFMSVPCDLSINSIYVTPEGQIVLSELDDHAIAEVIYQRDPATPSSLEVARRREVWSLVSTLREMLSTSANHRAAMLRDRIAKMLDEGDESRIVVDLAAALSELVSDPTTVLRSTTAEAYGERVIEPPPRGLSPIPTQTDDPLPIIARDPAHLRDTRLAETPVLERPTAPGRSSDAQRRKPSPPPLIAAKRSARTIVRHPTTPVAPMNTGPSWMAWVIMMALVLTGSAATLATCGQSAPGAGQTPTPNKAATGSSSDAGQRRPYRFSS